MWHPFRRREEVLDKELRFHIEQQVQDYIAHGLSDAEARRRAQLEFGGIEQVKEASREVRSTRWFEDLWSDTRYALRSLRRTPAFTLVALLTLAIGIGANTAIFSVVNAVILEPLPYANPDRLVRIVQNVPPEETRNGRPARTTSLTADEALLLQEARTLSHVVVYSSSPMTLSRESGAVTVAITEVSPSAFEMLGVRPESGRAFDASGADGPHVVVISHDFWRTEFDADPDIVGQVVTLEGEPHRLIGIMPREFAFPNANVAFWRPLSLTASGSGPIRRYGALARVDESATLESSAAEVRTMMGTFTGISPSQQGSEPPRFELVRIQDERAAPIRPALIVISWAAALVLLIACANVANLQLVRTEARAHEIEIRTALGAGRVRIVRQLIVESLLLGLSGGVLGILLASAGTRTLTALWPGNVSPGPNVSPIEAIPIDGNVLLFALGISMLTGLLFGMAPAFGVSLARLGGAVRAGTAPWGRPAIRKLLGTGEVALAMMLLIPAGLLINSFLKLSSVDPGFDPDGVLVFQINAPGAAGNGREALNEALVARVGSLAEVDAAGYSLASPLELTALVRYVIEVPGLTVEEMMDGGTLPRSMPVSWNYLEASGLSLREGRWFTEADGPGQPLVMMVNQEFARRYFPGRSPLGESVVSVGGRDARWEIVGVVDDVRQRGLDTDPEPEFFLEFRQMMQRSGDLVRAQAPGVAYFAVRTPADPLALVPGIRSILGELDPDASLTDVTTLRAVVADSVASPRFNALLVGVFAATALLLASIGVYGVVAYSVARRTREIGVRVALGATRWAVLSLVIRQGMTLAITGIVIGLAGAVAVTRYVSSMLFGIGPLDPATLLLAVCFFTIVTTVASYVPARRAALLDPLVALRND